MVSSKKDVGRREYQYCRTRGNEVGKNAMGNYEEKKLHEGELADLDIETATSASIEGQHCHSRAP